MLSVEVVQCRYGQSNEQFVVEACDRNSVNRGEIIVLQRNSRGVPYSSSPRGAGFGGVVGLQET